MNLSKFFYSNQWNSISIFKNEKSADIKEVQKQWSVNLKISVNRLK